MIISGDIYEIFEYEKPIILGSTNNSNGRSISASDEEKIRHRTNTMNKAKTTLRRLVNANKDVWGESPKFMTLTFAENVQDTKTANYEFKKFRQRLEYKFSLKLKYIVVVEFQKRGAIHYHAIFFNLPYIKATELAKIWRNGFIKINKIDKVDNVGAYVSKYMTKTDYDNLKIDKLVGLKSYFTSRGLVNPVIITEKKEIEQLASALSPREVYTSEFENEYLGQIKYTQFNLKR